MAGKVITDFIKLQMYKKGGAIATDKAVQFAANALEKRLINLGVDPSTLNSQTQLKQLLAYVKQAEDAAFNQMNVLSGKDAENALKKFMGQDTSADVFDLTGKKIDTSQGIMGGKSVKDLMESGEVTQGTVTKKSDKVKDREMFKEANERFKKNETEAEILERLNRENKETVQKIKNRKILDEAIEDASPGFANDIKYDAEIVAENLAMRRGLVYDDLPTKERLKIYDEAYTGLSNQRFKNKPKPDDDEPGFYTGGIVDVEPNLSDIGHGSDALMSRTRLMSPGSQATTSTGLNYLLAEDNDNIRVPFQDGLSAAKKYGNIFVEDETMTDKGKEIIKEKTSELIPSETEKEKKEKEMFEMVKEFQKFKRANPNSLLSFRMFSEQKKKEKELYKNKVLELAVKYPDKKIINKEGFVDKKELKETIDQAEADFEISPVDGLILKRSVNTEGEQSATSGSFDINNFSFTSPNIEGGELKSSANFDIGNLNLSGTLDTKDSNVLQSGIGFNYDNALKGKFSESDGFKTGELDLNKTFPISDKFNFNLEGGTDMMITPDGTTYKSSDLTPKLSYNDGILSADISKEILEGGNIPNLNIGASFPLFEKKFTGDLILDSKGKPIFDENGIALRKPDYTKDMGVVTLKGSNLLSDDKGGTIGYQKEFGNKDGNLFFTAGGEKSLFDDDYTLGAGLKFKYADGGRIGFKSGTDLKKRAFLKLMAALTGGIASIKSGLIGLSGKEAPAQVTKEVVKQSVPDVPPHFLKLVETITKFGDDTMATQDKVIAKKYKDYYMEKDFAGNIEITKTKTGANEFGEGPIEEVYMKYTAPDDALPDGKSTIVKRGDYEEFTARPDMEGKMKDVEDGVPDDIIEEVMTMDDTIIKKAEGGRIGFSAGKSFAKLLADKTITGSSRKFLEKVFGKESFENMIKNDPELYRGLLETVEMFRKRDKEGLKMYMQKFLPHMDDETVEDFIIGSGDTEGIQGQLIRLGSGRDYAGKIEMMKRADQMKKLGDLEITDEMVRKPNASGGIAKLLGE